MDLQNLLVNKIGVDKVLHFLCGGWFTSYLTLWCTEWYIMLFGIFIGLLKELIDKYIRKTSFCYWDWFWTSLGGIVYYLSFKLLELI